MTPFWIGMSITDFAAIAGTTRWHAESWLRNNGYSWHGGHISLARTAAEKEADIARRIAMAPPAVPCWRCGARICSHQGMAVAA